MPDPVSELFGDFSFRDRFGGQRSLLGGGVPGQGAIPLVYTKRRYSFGEYGVPHLLASFAEQQAGPTGTIARAAEARRRGAIEGSAGAFYETSRSRDAQARALGIPAYYARQQVNELRPLFEAQTAAQLAEIDAGEQEDIFNLLSATTSAISRASEFAIGLDFQKYQIKKAQDAARRANKFGLIGDVIGAVGAAIGGRGGGGGVAP